jgi:hypothetical protein
MIGADYIFSLDMAQLFHCGIPVENTMILADHKGGEGGCLDDPSQHPFLVFALPGRMDEVKKSDTTENKQNGQRKLHKASI